MNDIITIVTPSFNQGRFLEKTIRSVLSQEGPFHVDYVVHDGGSTDCSVEILKAFERRIVECSEPGRHGGLAFRKPTGAGSDLIRCRGVRFRWTSAEDGGQADAVNRGWKEAAGDILGWINSDDTYYPGAFGAILGANWRKADFVYGKGMWVRDDDTPLAPYPTFRPTRCSLFFQCTLCQPAVFAKRSAAARLGPLDTSFSHSFDYEFWLRAVFRSCVFASVPTFVSTSRMYPENKTLRSTERVTRECRTVRSKYYDGVRLNPLGMYVAKRTVNRPTRKRVSLLKRRLEEHYRRGEAHDRSGSGSNQVS